LLIIREKKNKKNIQNDLDISENGSIFTSTKKTKIIQNKTAHSGL